MDLIGQAPAIEALRAEIASAAETDVKILLSGESGVGKEVVAHLIHSTSGRSRKPLITLNCAGVPDSLLETEFFGHTRGSFTGAHRDRRGHLEMAHQGTIFLDEIGEMSLRMQSLLLRFLETGEIQRVGADVPPAHVDVRVIAASNRDLPEQVALGAFRADLYYRINVVNLRVPPLRERREDIPLFLDYFMKTYAKRYGVEMRPLDPAIVARLTEYHWPGNVRELKNVAERLTLKSRIGTIRFADLPSDLMSSVETGPMVEVHTERYRADVMYERLVNGGESFWTVVYEPFMSRDLTRDDIRHMIVRGLEATHGSYKQLVALFNMGAGDYKRFLNFLRKHDCHLPFQRFRGLIGRPPPPAPAAPPAREFALPGSRR